MFTTGWLACVSAFISDGPLPAFVYAVHAIDATAVIDLVCFCIDTGCFAITGA